MLVVDRIELVARDQSRKVRKLHRDDAAGREQPLHAGDKVVEVRHVREDIVSQQKVGTTLLRRDRLRRAAAEEGHARRNSLGFGRVGDVGCRLDAEHRHAPGHEVLQQVAVVAGDLHHHGRARQREALRNLLDIEAGMFDPACGKRRKVRVLGEDLVRRHVLLQLNQEARLANIGVQRVERLHQVQLIGGDVCLAQRRRSQVEEGRAQRRMAEAAVEAGGTHRRCSRAA